MKSNISEKIPEKILLNESCNMLQIHDSMIHNINMIEIKIKELNKMNHVVITRPNKLIRGKCFM